MKQRKPILKIVEQMAKEINSKELLMYQETIKKVVADHSQLIKNLNLEESLKKLEKPIKESLLGSNKETFYLVPQISTEEKMRMIIRQELKSFKNNQITIIINSKEEVIVGTDRFELYQGGIQLLRIFSDTNGYSTVSEIMSKTNIYNTEESLRKSIAKINSKFRSNLNLKDKIIIGKRGSGYKLNPLYLIEFKK